MNHRLFLLIVLTASCAVASSCSKKNAEPPRPLYNAQGVMAGEVTVSSAILQTRLTATPGPVDGDVPGKECAAAFEISTEESFPHYMRTEWLHATPESDFIVKRRFTGLQPGVRYYYRPVYALDPDSLFYGAISSFKTWSDSAGVEPVSFTVLSIGGSGRDSADFRTLAAIKAMHPDFIVGVVTDYGKETIAAGTPLSRVDARRMWHGRFADSLFKDLLTAVPGYWLQGSAVTAGDENNLFIEQFPVTVADSSAVPLYRTVRVNPQLQFWFLQNEDGGPAAVRSENPDTAFIGGEQAEWLKRSLTDCDAAFKIIVTPASRVVVGTAPAGKGTDGGGMSDLPAWLETSGCNGASLIIIDGNAPRQYRYVRSSGIEEYAAGTIEGGNADKPAENRTSDTESSGEKVFDQENGGGFLFATLTPGVSGGKGVISFTWYDSDGKQRYTADKTGL